MLSKSVLHTGVLSAVFATALTVSGCGTMPGERAVSGGVLGAGAGAAIGSLSGNAGKGAIIGGVGGAALGALTTPSPGYAYDPYYGRSYYRPYCVRYDSYTGRCISWR